MHGRAQLWLSATIFRSPTTGTSSSGFQTPYVWILTWPTQSPGLVHVRIPTYLPIGIFRGPPDINSWLHPGRAWQQRNSHNSMRVLSHLPTEPCRRLPTRSVSHFGRYATVAAVPCTSSLLKSCFSQEHLCFLGLLIRQLIIMPAAQALQHDKIHECLYANLERAREGAKQAPQCYCSEQAQNVMSNEFCACSRGKVPHEWQLDEAEAIALGLDSILISATGSGKTIPIMLLLLLPENHKKTIVVISPLKSLESDQVTHFVWAL